MFIENYLSIVAKTNTYSIADTKWGANAPPKHILKPTKTSHSCMLKLKKFEIVATPNLTFGSKYFCSVVVEITKLPKT